MIALILGTVAEAIKMAPVVRQLTDRGNHVEIWNTAMHVRSLTETIKALVPGVEQRDLYDSRRTDDIARTSQMPGWIAEVAGASYRSRSDLRAALERDSPSLVVVHGDTATTVLGALLAQLLGVDLAHVEAGYRSGSVWAPFPEELDRRIVGRIADIHYAPGDREVANLRNAKGTVVNTFENTAIDALRLALEMSPSDSSQPSRYGVVTLHRFELMRRPEALRTVLSECREAALDRAIYFFTGPHGRARLAEHGLTESFDDRFILEDKLPYLEFAAIVAGAEFVLTDSGGLAMECAYLGIPCLVHRDRIEDPRGIGENAVLSHFDMDVVRDFLKDPSRWRRPSRLHDHHPSAIIVESLVELGFAR